MARENKTAISSINKKNYYNTTIYEEVPEKDTDQYFIAQDGATKDLPWGDFDCLFIGGTTNWKLSQSAGDLIAEAKKNHKWVHVGRVNSYRRLNLVSILGADSCDGTFLAFGPDKNLPRLLRWFDYLKEQPSLNLNQLKRSY